MNLWGWLMGRIGAGRRRDNLPPGLVRLHPDELRARAIEREQARIVARLAALGVRVDVPARSAGNGHKGGQGGAIPR